MYGNVSNSAYKKNPHSIFESYLVSTIYKIRAPMMITKKHTTPIRLCREIAMTFSLSTVSEIEDIRKQRDLVKQYNKTN